MKKSSFSLIAIFAIVFSVASAFTTSKFTTTIYVIFGILLANQPSNPNDATWYPANGSHVTEQSSEYTSAQLDDIRNSYCDLSQRICFGVIKIDDGVVDHNFIIIRLGDFVP